MEPFVIGPALATLPTVAVPLPATSIVPASNLSPVIPDNLHSQESLASAGQRKISGLPIPDVRARPIYKRNPEPVYPPSARRRGQKGNVCLLVHVTNTGRVETVQIEQGSGFALLDQAALEAVRNWEFEPARLNSSPVESDIEIPIQFNLSN